MSLSQSIKHLIPTNTRAHLKQRFPLLILRLAIWIDLVPTTGRRALRSGRLVLNWLRKRPIPHRLSIEMWTGFEDRAVTALEQLKLGTRRRGEIVESAAWSLAQRYAYRRDYATALDNLLLMITAKPRLRRNVNVQLMVVECLLHLGRIESAQEWLQWASKGIKKPRTEFYLSAANIAYERGRKTELGSTSDAERLMHLNQVYEQAGFSPLEKIDENAPLTLDNITSSRTQTVDPSAKLSVLIPAYNCADTLPIALRSILNQTWHNLEVIIVDDQSSDDTWKIIERFSQLDKRIIPIRHERNGGAYAARNTALTRATGEFVTVHDADDWSHPEKFAAQMLHALSNPGSVSTTVGVRVSRDLRFDVKGNTGGMIIENTSSLLLKRDMLQEIGGWDPARVGADSELYERVRAKHGLTPSRLFRTTPLTLILYSGSSLTQSKATGIATVNYGARRQYKEAYRHWHATELLKKNPDFRITTKRRFPAPRIMLGQRGLITDIDIVFIDNFADEGRSYEQLLSLWNDAVKRGLKAGIVHCPVYMQASANIVLTVRAAIAQGLVENLVPGETISCKVAVAADTGFLDTPPAPLPSISSELVYVIATDDLSEQHQEALGRYLAVPCQVQVGSSLLPILMSLKEKALQTA